MKKLLFIALLLSGTASFAQKKNDLCADIAISTPGGSVTYDRRVLRHLAVGGGVNLYDWGTNRVNFRTAICADIRPYWQFRRGLLLTFVDVGWAFYSDNKPQNSYEDYTKGGLHTALGIGYGYRVLRRGGGPYISFTLRGYSISAHDSNPIFAQHPEAAEYGVYEFNSVLSVGFKF